VLQNLIISALISSLAKRSGLESILSGHLAVHDNRDSDVASSAFDLVNWPCR
jgi:hypothetical protein